MRLHTAVVLALVFLFAIPTCGLAAEEYAAGRPNLVMVFIDDQRSDAVGYAGNEAVHTPNLDRLATQGLIFENCFVNTSICAISAAAVTSWPERSGRCQTVYTTRPPLR